jgi:hypothetical protein
MGDGSVQLHGDRGDDSAIGCLLLFSLVCCKADHPVAAGRVPFMIKLLGPVKFNGVGRLFCWIFCSLV